MANHLDLEEQEQLDQLKHFWKQYGNLITWGLIVVLGAFAAWNGYHYWQRTQSVQAAAMYDEVERMARSGDIQKTDRAFSEMKDRFASTTYAQQAALLVAKVSYEKGDVDAAKAALSWVVDKASDKGYAAIARLRLSGLLIEAKSYDDALKLLPSNGPEEFAALTADRRGDIYLAQGNNDQAKVEYRKAYQAFESRADYRRLVEVKLNALGGNAAVSENGAIGSTRKPEPAK